MKKVFCENLRKIRGERSQKDFAHEIGAKQTTYSAWETGAREPDLTTLCRIAAVTGVTPNSLLGFEPLAPPPPQAARKLEDLKTAIAALLKEY